MRCCDSCNRTFKKDEDPFTITIMPYDIWQARIGSVHFEADSETIELCGGCALMFGAEGITRGLDREWIIQTFVKSIQNRIKRGEAKK